mmetsp:Transcript_39392/g.92686  ORF Transcript_39392/g.92686 Transcript_39392/m.92686 type:complete len:214 (-) Transcript_39392:598-1239(-)
MNTIASSRCVPAWPSLSLSCKYKASASLPAFFASFTSSCFKSISVLLCSTAASLLASPSSWHKVCACFANFKPAARLSLLPCERCAAICACSIAASPALSPASRHFLRAESATSMAFCISPEELNAEIKIDVIACLACCTSSTPRLPLLATSSSNAKASFALEMAALYSSSPWWASASFTSNCTPSACSPRALRDLRPLVATAMTSSGCCCSK